MPALLFIFLVNAAIPLVHFCSHRGLMGELLMPLWLQILSWLCAASIVAINVSLLSAVVG